jgi:hypothetical protein
VKECVEKMYDINLVRNLLNKTAVNVQYSVCDTCIHQNDGKSCRYRNNDKCSDNLEEYAPNTKMINS